MESTTQTKLETLIMAVVFFFIVLIAIWFFSRKQTKEELAKYYRITRPTLKKWIRYFTPSNINPDEWDKKRKLLVYDTLKIKQEWGEDSAMVLTKSEIAKLLDSDTRTIGDNIKKFPQKYGITFEIWKSCQFFPPVICKRIIDGLS